MPDYKNAKIYKIVDNTNGNIYVGSTTKQYLCSRLAEHKADMKRYEEGTLNLISSSQIIKNGDYSMVLIESFPCETKDQLRYRERYWTDNTPNCINIQNAIRTTEDVNAYLRKYRKEKFICSCGKSLTKGTLKSKHYQTKFHIENCK